MRWLLGCLVVVAACRPAYGGIELRLDNESPGAEVSSDEIVARAGYVLLVTADLESRKRKDYDATEDTLELVSEDESVLLVEPTDVAWEFVLIGDVAGETCVRVIVNDEEVDCIPATVVAQ